MSEFSGVVQRHSIKDWNGKTFYSFALSGQDGWFNTGLKKPPAEGTSVSFKAAPNARGFLEVNTKTLEVRQDGEPQAAIPAPKVANAATGGYWEDRAKRDVHNDALRELGASRNTAIAILDLMLKNEAIKLPAKPADKEAILWEVIERYTSKLMGKGSTEVPTTSPGNGPVEPNNKNEEDDWA